MNKEILNHRLMACAVLAALFTAGCAKHPAPKPAEQPMPVAKAERSVTVESVRTAEAEVLAVDMKTRHVVLKAQDGEEFTIVAGKEVKNLSHVKPGNMVVAKYYEGFAAEIVKPGDATPGVSAVSAQTQAKPGEKPQAFKGEMVTMTVKVVSLDLPNGVVVVRGPLGLLHAFQPQRPELQDYLKKLAVGDSVEVAFTQAIAIAVEPAMEKSEKKHSHKKK